MPNNLFVDTWGWLTLADARETRHREVVEFYQTWLKNGEQFYTTDYVFDETYTLMFKRLNSNVAKQIISGLIASFTDSRFPFALDYSRTIRPNSRVAKSIRR